MKVNKSVTYRKVPAKNNSPDLKGGMILNVRIFNSGSKRLLCSCGQ